MKNIAIIIAHGPEVRAFLHSGLVSSLAEHCNVWIVSRRPESVGIFESARVTVLPIPQVSGGRILPRLRSVASRAHSEFAGRSGKKLWQHYLTSKGKSTHKHRMLDRFARLLGRSLLGVSLVELLERVVGRVIGTDAGWKQLFSSRSIDCLITSSYGSPYAVPALQTAINLGVKSIVINNSWKDVYTTPRVPVMPSAISVWNEKAKDSLCSANSTLKRDAVRVMPSMHLQPFYTQGGGARDDLSKELQLDPTRPFVCYTTASPNAVRREEKIVEYLVGLICEGSLPGRPQLLIRLNPMENSSRFNYLQNWDDVIIQRPNWEWEPEADWNCALADDVSLWVSIVRHAAVNISIPSTVTTEFEVLCKPVINVCFDFPEALPEAESNKRFWNAEFYSEAKSYEYCWPAFSFEELEVRLRQSLELATERVAEEQPKFGKSPLDGVLSLVREVSEL